MFPEERDALAQAARLEALVDEIESFPDPAVREKVAEIVRGLLALYGEGLGRMLGIVARQLGPSEAPSAMEAFARDDLVSHLLLLHDLHPVDVEERVARALDAVRPSLHAHGGDVELLGVEGGVARIHLQGHCDGCPSSSMTLKSTIEEALLKAAPDLVGIEAEGAAEPAAPAGFVPISMLAALEAR